MISTRILKTRGDEENSPYQEERCKDKGEQGLTDISFVYSKLLLSTKIQRNNKALILVKS